MSKKQPIKRLRGISSETSLDATADDFEEESHQFRFHKKSKPDATTIAKRKKGKLKKTLITQECTNRSSASETSIALRKSDNTEGTTKKDVTPLASISIDECLKENISTGSWKSLKIDNQRKHIASLEDINFQDEVSPKNVFLSDDAQLEFLELEKSICSESERLCPSCKHIVPSHLYSSHFTECLKKFSYVKGKKYDDKTQKEDILPCPVCLKPFHSKSQRLSHIKSCAQLHGLSGEQTILASRLQEKQREERLSLGLPSINFSAVEKKETKKDGEKNAQKDPDLALAVALSCSLAEEEKDKREKEEDALLQLGLPLFIQEKRRINKLVLPQPNSVLPQAKGTKRRRNVKQKNTILMTRTADEREQIISEKVASILSVEYPISNKGSKSVVEARGVLKHYQDKNCTIWNMSHCDLNIPIEDNYVAELNNFINVQELPVGGLLKHYSQVPGRLDFTVANEGSNEQDLNDDENKDSPTDQCETSIVDNYCTQLALAELLNSQDLSKFCFDETKNDKQYDLISLISSSGSNSPQSHQIAREEEEVLREVTDGEEEVLREVTDGEEEVLQEVTDGKEGVLREVTDGEEGVLQLVTDEGKSSNIKTGFDEISSNTSSLKISANNGILQSKLLCDWSSLLASGEWSDMQVITKNGEIPCHSLVLKVRCPSLLFEGNLSGNDASKKSIDLSSISLNSVRKFLHYLYTGSILLKSKDDPCWIELFDLALKFKCKELVCYLESVYSSSSSSVQGSSIDHRKMQGDSLSSMEVLSAEDAEKAYQDSKEQIIESQQITEGLRKAAEGKLKTYNNSLESKRQQRHPERNGGEHLQTPTKIVVVDSNSPNVSNSPGHSETATLPNYSPIQVSSPPCSPTTKSLPYYSPTSKQMPTSLNNSFISKDFQNKPSVKETQSLSDNSEYGSEQCYTISPDIFEESANNCNFVKTPELTPPILDRPNAEGENEPFDGVEIFGNACDHFDSHRRISKRKLFPNLATGSSEDAGNLSPKKMYSLRSDASSCQMSPLQGVDGVVDLTLSSDDSLDGSKMECHPLPSVDKESLNNTLPFVDKDSLDNTLPFVDKDSLDNTLPFVDKDSLDNTLPFVNKGSLDNTLPFVDKESLDNTLPIVDHVPVDRTLLSSRNDKTPVSDNSIPCVALSQIKGRSENPVVFEKIMYNGKDQSSKQFNEYEPTESSFNVVPESKNSAVLQNIIQANKEFELISDRAVELPDQEIIVLSPKTNKSYSPILEPVPSPDKEDSFISTAWDDFDDGVLYYRDSPVNDVTPLKQDTPASITSLISAAVTPIFRNSLKTDLGLNSCDNEVGSPVIEAHFNAKDKSDTSVNLGEDTLLMAVTEAETQNTPSNITKTAKQPKGKPIYKSKSCTFGAVNKTISEVQQFDSPSQLKTPVALKKWGSQNITPMPDYRTMVSPELKKELDRYGIRKLSRKKAITLLTHIYDQLHPFVSDAETDSSYVETPDKDVAAVSTRALVAKIKQIGPSKLASEPPSSLAPKFSRKSPLRSSSSTDDLNASQSSIASLDESENECLEESVQFSDDEADQEEISLTQQGSLDVRIKNFIKSDPSMHEQILMYEPIWANELQANLKANGIKCSMQSLLDFLDQQCITFRLPTNRNRKKDKLKSPTKKGRQKSPSKRGKQISPSKKGTQKGPSKKGTQKSPSKKS